MIRSVDAVERSVHKTNEWLNELTEALHTEDREYAWRVLRADLQILRDLVNDDEAAQLAAQLPMVLRGAFYDGFDPGRPPLKVRNADDFAELMGERAQVPHAGEALRAAQAATHVLEQHVSPGEMEEVLSQIPRGLRKVVDPA
jgi:uncharacterized protein (DUF2267 family)